LAHPSKKTGEVAAKRRGTARPSTTQANEGEVPALSFGSFITREQGKEGEISSKRQKAREIAKKDVVLEKIMAKTHL